MNKRLIKEIEDYTYEMLADYYAPLTDDMLCDAMQDGEMVSTAFSIAMANIEKHFKEVEGIEREEAMNIIAGVDFGQDLKNLNSLTIKGGEK